MGVERTSAGGWSSGHRASCAPTSWVALMRYQVAPSAQKASEHCVIGERDRWRAAWQLSHRQFHCGRPPPAAAPIRRRRIVRMEMLRAGCPVQALARDWQRLLPRVHVRRDFRAKRDLLELRLHPHPPTPPGTSVSRSERGCVCPDYTTGAHGKSRRPVLANRNAVIVGLLE